MASPRKIQKMDYGSPHKSPHNFGSPHKSPHKSEDIDEIHYKECKNLCYSLLGKFQQVKDGGASINEVEEDISQTINDIIQYIPKIKSTIKSHNEGLRNELRLMRISLSNSKSEKSKLSTSLQRTEKELMELKSMVELSHDQRIERIKELTNSLKSLELSYGEERDRFINRLKSYDEDNELQAKENASLKSEIEALKADNQSKSNELLSLNKILQDNFNKLDLFDEFQEESHAAEIQHPKGHEINAESPKSNNKENEEELNIKQENKNIQSKEACKQVD